MDRRWNSGRLLFALCATIVLAGIALVERDSDSVVSVATAERIVIRGETVTPAPGEEILPEEGLIRGRLARFDIATWRATLETAPTNLAHEFFEGEILETPTFATRRDGDPFAWQSQLDNGGASLYFEAGRVYGTVNFADRRYSVLTRGDGLVQVLEFGDASAPPTTAGELPRTH